MSLSYLENNIKWHEIRWEVWCKRLVHPFVPSRDIGGLKTSLCKRHILNTGLTGIRDTTLKNFIREDRNPIKMAAPFYIH
jgi:hypothetical protein